MPFLSYSVIAIPWLGASLIFTLLGIGVLKSLSEKYFFDLREEFALLFEATQIVGVGVDGTNTYAFSAKGFDNEKATLAMYQNKLPSNIHFTLDNGVKLSLFGDPIEYFYLYLEKV